MSHRFEQFDKDFERAQKATIGAFVAASLVTLSGLGFGVWVIIKLLAHFGVL